MQEIDEHILLIDKPKGITSFDVIRQLRRELGVRKMGHAGTLDPLASGLMIIGVESGTKKLTQYVGLPKTYEAEILIGEKRTTGDMDGDIVEEKDVTDISVQKIKETLDTMKGELVLPVSAYSAMKQGGEALYKKVRKGKKYIIPKRHMEVISVEFVRVEQKGRRVHVFVIFSVSSGTYIRSLAEEFGERLGYPATLANLRRTKVGKFRVEDAQKLS